MNRIRKCFSLFLILVIAVGILAGCDSNTSKEFQEMRDFEKAKIGVLVKEIKAIYIKISAKRLL